MNRKQRLQDDINKLAQRVESNNAARNVLEQRYAKVLTAKGQALPEILRQLQEFYRRLDNHERELTEWSQEETP